MCLAPSWGKQVWAQLTLPPLKEATKRFHCIQIVECYLDCDILSDSFHLIRIIVSYQIARSYPDSCAFGTPPFIENGKKYEFFQLG